MVIEHYSLSTTIHNIRAFDRFEDLNIILSNISPKYSIIGKKCLRYFYFKTLFLRFLVGRDLIVDKKVKDKLIAIIINSYKKYSYYDTFLSSMNMCLSIMQKKKYSFLDLKEYFLKIFESPYLTQNHYSDVVPFIYYEKLTNKQKEILEKNVAGIFNNFMTIKIKYYND